MSVEAESTTIEHLNLIILILGYYLLLLMRYQKQNNVILHILRKPLELKLRCYADRLVDLNEYMPAFPISKERDKIFDTELNEFCWT